MLFTFFIQRENSYFVICDVDRTAADCSQNWLNPLKCQTTNTIQKKNRSHSVLSMRQDCTPRVQRWQFPIFRRCVYIHSREFSTFTSSSQFPFNATSASRDFPFMDERMSKQYKRKKKEGTNRELSTAGVVQQLLSSVTACCSLHAQQRGKGATKLRRL